MFVQMFGKFVSQCNVYVTPKSYDSKHLYFYDYRLTQVT